MAEWDQTVDKYGKCMKYNLIALNLIIFFGGLYLTVLGIWTIVDYSFANDLLGTNIYTGSVYVLIITGLLATLISCLGCFGSIKEVRCILVIYFTALLVIFVTMVVGGILCYVFRSKVLTSIRLGMERSLHEYGNYKPITDAWDETQTRLKCCGVYSPRDWEFRIPESCCQQTASGVRVKCQLLPENNAFTIHNRGCLNVTLVFVRSHAVIVGTSGIIVSCILILGMICSCALFKIIK